MQFAGKGLRSLRSWFSRGRSMIEPSNPQRSLATGAKLGCGAAIWNALLSRSIDFYPRVAQGCIISTLGVVPAIEEMAEASARWTVIENNDALTGAIDLAKQSLAEVLAQTDYQDQKATRLLTIT